MKKTLRTLSVLLAVTGIPVAVWAADHGDSPAAVSDPTADITDLYAWMSNDATKLNLVLAVNTDAGRNAAFSDAVSYVFSVSSSEAYGQRPQAAMNIVCKFVDDTNIECWAGGDYVRGDPSNPEGIVSDNEGLRVFAGLRDDPFFLEYVGFGNTVNGAVAAVAANQVAFDDEGCPLLTPEQGTLLRGLLTSGADGAPASNTFAGQNVLALVLEVDTALVNSGGPILGVWASTHASN